MGKGWFWVNEGPAVIKHNGKIFLTYSASETGECYCMGMLSIGENEEILNPRAWKKECNPVLKLMLISKYMDQDIIRL